jgi:CHAT domain-containing protein
LTLAATTSAGAQVVVEHVAPSGGAAAGGLRADDLVKSWRSAEDRERSGRLVHWGDLELLDILESARGAVVLEIERGGRALSLTLPNRQWDARARPRAAAAAAPTLEAALEGLRADPERAASEVRVLAASTTPEIASWLLASLGRAAAAAGQWRTAHEAYAGAAELAPRPFAAELQRHAADALARTGEVAGAEAGYTEALAIWEEHEPGGLGSSMVLSAHGALLGSQFDLVRASELMERACRLRRGRAPASWQVAFCLTNLGVLAGRRNDLATAEAIFLETLEIQRSLGMSGREPLANLGIVARLRGDYERAEAYMRATVELDQEEDAPSTTIASHLMNLANVLASAGRLEESIATYDEVLAIYREQSPGVRDHARATLNRGIAHELLGDLESAERDLLQAKAMLAFDAPRQPDEASIVQKLAEIALHRGVLSRAAELGAAAFEAQAHLRPDSSYEALAAALLARIRVELGEHDAAEALFRRAIEAIETQQERIGGGDRGLAAFRGKFTDIYRGYQDLLLQLGRPREAYELYERSRAQGLLAMMGERTLELEDELPPEVERERRRLQAAIEDAYRSLSRLPFDAAEPRAALRLRIETLHADREAISARLRGGSARVAALESPPALPLAKIQSSLDEGTVILAYSLSTAERAMDTARGGATLFVIARTGPVEAHRLTIRSDEIAALVERWVELTTAPRERAAVAAVTRSLSDALLGPAATHIRSARRLLVIPDGALHYLSFAALREPGGDRYLVELTPIATEVSASIWTHDGQRRPSAPAARRVVAFGDPDYDSSETARFRRDFGRLPATRKEALAVAEVFGNRARVFLDADATEEAALRELPAAEIAHFACHAAIDESLPLDSALLLTPAEGGGSLLQAWEILEKVRLDAELVVLSACDTARGKLRGGEGMTGLVRSLRIAGARSVVASLWTVPDESTAVLMERFYRHLERGARAEEALRQAQLELLRGPVEIERDGAMVRIDASSPRHWAPFVLIGRTSG